MTNQTNKIKNVQQQRVTENDPAGTLPDEYRINTIQLLQQLYGTTEGVKIHGLSVRCGQQRYELFR